MGICVTEIQSWVSMLKAKNTQIAIGQDVLGAFLTIRCDFCLLFRGHTAATLWNFNIYLDSEDNPIRLTPDPALHFVVIAQ